MSVRQAITTKIQLGALKSLAQGKQITKALSILVAHMVPFKLFLSLVSTLLPRHLNANLLSADIKMVSHRIIITHLTATYGTIQRSMSTSLIALTNSARESKTAHSLGGKVDCLKRHALLSSAAQLMAAQQSNLARNNGNMS